jgi:hypothetical protein
MCCVSHGSKIWGARMLCEVRIRSLRPYWEANVLRIAHHQDWTDHAFHTNITEIQRNNLGFSITLQCYNTPSKNTPAYPNHSSILPSPSQM